jgi:hypothetical protein
MPPSARPQKRPGSLQEVLLSGTTSSYRPSLFDGLRISRRPTQGSDHGAHYPRCGRSRGGTEPRPNPPGPQYLVPLRAVSYSKPTTEGLTAGDGGLPREYHRGSEGRLRVPLQCSCLTRQRNRSSNPLTLGRLDTMRTDQPWSSRLRSRFGEHPAENG